MMEYRYAGRRTLNDKKGKSKPIDMDYVYGQIDLGRTVSDVAKELGVSTKTLQRRHKKYQEEARLVGERDERESLYSVTDRTDDDPFTRLQ